MYAEVQNIVNIEIKVYGRVTQSDIVGAVFGQTEDVLGKELELRNLQKTNQIGRIEVKTEFDGTNTVGLVTIPSYMDRTMTVVIAASLETINKIGPCRAEARVKDIENIKSIKIRQIIDHTKKVLEKFMSISVASQELIDEVVNDVRMSRVEKYGKEGQEVLCGPDVVESDQLIFVESLDDVRNLLKAGINNVVAFEDCSKTETLRELAEKHEVIIFINKGKDFLVKKICEFADADSFTRPDVDKRISELESKELFKAIRNTVSCNQITIKRPVIPEQNYSSNSSSVVSSTVNSGQAFPKPVQTERPAFPRPIQTERPQFQRPEQRLDSRPTFQRQEQRPESRLNTFQQRPDFRQDPRNDSRRESPQPYRPLQQTQQISILNSSDETLFKSKLSEVSGKNMAIVIDKEKNVLGQIPMDAIVDTVKGLSNVYSIIVDGKISKELIFASEKANVKFLVGTSSDDRSNRVRIVTNLK